MKQMNLEIKRRIVRHTRLGTSIRKKLKRMLGQLQLPDIEIERTILNYIGIPKCPIHIYIQPKTKLYKRIEK